MMNERLCVDMMEVFSLVQSSDVLNLNLTKRREKMPADGCDFRIEYKYIRNEIGDVLECDSCDSIAPLAEFNESFPKQKRSLCELCASSQIGNVTLHPEQYPDSEIFEALAQVGNIILDKITGRKRDIED